MHSSVITGQQIIATGCKILQRLRFIACNTQCQRTQEQSTNVSHKWDTPLSISSYQWRHTCGRPHFTMTSEIETCTVMENQAIPIRYRRSCIHHHQTSFPSPSVPAAFDFHPHPLPQHFSVLHIFVKLSQKYTGYTALHNSQSHRISQSQALSARFIIFCFRYHGSTVLNATVPTVLPQSLSPLPQQLLPLPR